MKIKKISDMKYSRIFSSFQGVFQFDREPVADGMGVPMTEVIFISHKIDKIMMAKDKENITNDFKKSIEEAKRKVEKELIEEENG